MQKQAMRLLGRQPRESILAKVNRWNGAADRSEFGFRRSLRGQRLPRFWMGVAFLVAFALAAVVLTVFGTGEGARRLPWRDRKMVVCLFLVGLCRERRSTIIWTTGWNPWRAEAANSVSPSRPRRWFMLASSFGSSITSADPSGGMTLFWAGILSTYLLALFSFLPLSNPLGRGLWRVLRLLGMEYIAFVFATDFIFLHFHDDVLRKQPFQYMPFAFMLVLGVALRIAAFVKQQFRQTPSVQPT